MNLVVHSPRAFSVERFLCVDECAALIALAEREGFAAAGVRTADGPKAMPAIRNNERAMLAAPEWVALIWQRLCQVELPQLEGESALALPRELRFYKYLPGQRFKMHKDGPWREDGRTSRLTLLVYLNDGFTGGDTDFRDFRVKPEAGAALLFVHDTWHEGAAIEAGTKYVLRSDVMYGAA
ncbi:Predicted 2-oxoglutarate-and Fe(II)-dependent dioxygenase YbiX [Variovorax sp. PDC80]|uniref:prolyl hydroxylase family protein n=1 Tax=Variovorax sp. PDC80 TaxID=1882827 RepID=UPI0008F2FF21|nr:2OG-Fe(II) oxygenase [Variovorax sp. PDC80]SFQ00418.1 Predicted 2-oxoglutarate-and Fe(II)-dependent dioxygenase YbiX [Variovorax sp. PDC80]